MMICLRLRILAAWMKEGQKNDHSGTYDEELEAIFEATQLADLRIAVQFIQALQSASLDDKYNAMDSKWLEQLRNPPDPDLSH